ncbi:MAG: hypothetical protein AAF799_29290 [Myxococcota bacterium]
MRVHTVSANQRRMLLELLASERAGEFALFIGRYLGRDRTASELCRLRLSDWVDEQEIIFTAHGRQVAESLANRLVDRYAYAELVS